MTVRFILVTGAAGFIPSALINSLCSLPSTFVVGVDNMLTGNSDNLRSISANNFQFIKTDVNDYHDISQVMLSFKFDYVFHYAAVVGVKRTLSNPLLVLKDIQGIDNVLTLCKNTGVKRVFFSSSSEVYGEPVEFPQNEDTTPLNSKLPYAIVKNVGEAFLKSFNYEHSLDYTIFRFFNTYGPYQSSDFVLSKFIRSALKGDDLTIYGDGSQTRTFCFIQDNIDATTACLENSCCVNDVVNIGSDIEVSILELAQRVLRITRSTSNIVHLPPLPEGDMSRRRPDISKMKSILNRPLLPLDDGIRSIVDHLQTI